MVEKLHPTTGSLQTIMQRDGAWASGRAGDARQDELEFIAMPGLQVRRGFSESVIQHDHALMGTGIKRDLVDSLTLDLTPATRLGFSREVNNVQDLRRALLSGSTKQTLSLAQDFGTGESSGTFEYKQIEAAKFTRGGELDPLFTEMMALQSGLGGGYDISAKLTTTDAPDLFGLHQRHEEFGVGLPIMGGTGKLALSNFQERKGIHTREVRKFDAAMPLVLSGGEGKLGFAKVTKVTDGQAEERRTFDVSAALAMFGGDTRAVYQRIAADKGGRSSAEQTLDLQMPLDTILSGASFAHKIEQIKKKKKPRREVRTSALEIPWQAFGAETKLDLRRTSTRQESALTTGYETKLTTQIEGQPLLFQFQNARTVGGSAHSKSDAMKLVIPKLSLVGDSTIGYELDVTHKDGTKTSRPTMELIVPLAFLGEDTSLVHTLKQVKRKKKATQEVRESTLAFPVDIGGATSEFKHTRKTVREPGDYRIVHDSLFSVPLAGEHLKLTRSATNIPGKEGAPDRERQTVVAFPKFKALTDWAMITGKYALSEKSGRVDYRTTHIDVQVEPTRTVKMIGNYRINDQGEHDSRDRRLFSSWHLKKNLSLNVLFHQLNDAENLATIVRNVQVKKESSGSGLGVQVGYTTWGQQGEEPEGAHDVRLSFGDPKNVEFRGRLSEYDEKKLKRFDDPIVQMAVQRGDPDRWSVKLEYEDASKRLAPMRGVKLAFPALGGSMQLGAAECPVGMDGKTVQPAQLYEASLKRKVFGGVDLSLGYHYWDYKELRQDDSTIQYLRLQLEGGKEDRGGKVAVAFRSGDFVPQPSDKKKQRPEALVDVSYTRGLGDAGRILLALHRPQFAKPGEKLQEFVEGRLEYGDLDVSYKSGVALPREKGQKVVPASVLSMSYEDRWSDESRLIITLHRTTPPEDSEELARSIEARVEYGTSF